MFLELGEVVLFFLFDVLAQGIPEGLECGLKVFVDWGEVLELIEELLDLFYSQALVSISASTPR